jgi:hypothetical protein
MRVRRAAEFSPLSPPTRPIKNTTAAAKKLLLVVRAGCAPSPPPPSIQPQLYPVPTSALLKVPHPSCPPFCERNETGCIFGDLDYHLENKVVVVVVALRYCVDGIVCKSSFASELVQRCFLRMLHAKSRNLILVLSNFYFGVERS